MQTFLDLKTNKMKWISVVVMLFAIACNSSFATDWTALASGTANSLWGMYFVDDNTGWVVGDGGTVRKTTDGGNSWVAQTSGAFGFLNQIRFLDANNGYIVGDVGKIISSTDGGSNWSFQNSGLTETLLSVAFANQNKGWVVGDAGKIVRTIDRGTNWTPLTSGTVEKLWCVEAVTTDIVYASGEFGTILKTTDGGDNWNTLTSNTTNVFWDLAFVSATKGWAVGESGIILQTTDGGSTWASLASPTTDDLYDVHFANENYGWVVGTNGNIIRTTDGGASWSFQTYSGFTANSVLARVYVTSNIVGYISCENGGFLKYNYSLATLTTTSVSTITNSTAVSGGNISTDGGSSITARGVVWSNSPNPTVSLSTKTSDGTGTGSFNSNITGLSAGTTYYVRAYATNSEGTAYGSQVSFTTTISTLSLPNNGDGNGDGIVDSLQSNVVTLLNTISNSYITVVSLNGTAINNTLIQSANSDANYSYPYGFLRFSINASSANIKIIYHDVANLNNYIFRKLDSQGNLFTLSNAVFSSEIIGGQQVATISFSLTDGGIGDYDGIVNGVITDPGGPAVAVSSIPTLSEWTKYSLILALFTFGIWKLRRLS